MTGFNSLRNAGARAGDVVAVQGIGGLGHLALQYSRAMGYKTVTLSSSPSKRELAIGLGAHILIDGKAEDQSKTLPELEGAAVVVVTAPDSESIDTLVNGLGINGKFLLLAVPPEITIPAGEFVSHDWESALAHVRPSLVDLQAPLHPGLARRNKSGFSPDTPICSTGRGALYDYQVSTEQGSRSI